MNQKRYNNPVSKWHVSYGRLSSFETKTRKHTSLLKDLLFTSDDFNVTFNSTGRFSVGEISSLGSWDTSFWFDDLDSPYICYNNIRYTEEPEPDLNELLRQYQESGDMMFLVQIRKVLLKRYERITRHLRLTKLALRDVGRAIKEYAFVNIQIAFSRICLTLKIISNASIDEEELHGSANYSAPITMFNLIPFVNETRKTRLSLGGNQRDNQ